MIREDTCRNVGIFFDQLQGCEIFRIFAGVKWKEKMDLSKLTQLELLDLRMKVNQEIESFSNRNKVKVFRVFLQFDGTRFFYQKENAIKCLLKMIENDEVYDEIDNEIKLSVGYYSKAECEQWCEDKPKEM